MDPFQELQLDKEAFKELVSIQGFPHNEFNYDQYMYAFCAGASIGRKPKTAPDPSEWVEIMHGRLMGTTLDGMKKYYAKGLYYGSTGVLI